MAHFLVAHRATLLGFCLNLWEFFPYEIKKTILRKVRLNIKNLRKLRRPEFVSFVMFSLGQGEKDNIS